MKAAIVEKPGVLVVQDIPVPQVGDYDALCELLYGATCTGTDQHLIAGHFPWPVQYPTVLGHESIGRVVQIGKRVRNYKPGDLVTRVGTPPPPGSGLDVNWGGYAEYGIAKDHWAMRADGLPEREWGAYRINQHLPPDFDPAAATMIITWRETLSYLTRMGVGQGASVLVIGSGGNGLAFAAHAHNRGASTVAVIGSVLRETNARAVGATDYYDYRASDAIDEIGQAYPQGFDAIIDAVGRTRQLDAALPLLKPGGMIGIYGIDEYGKCVLTPTRARGTFTFYNGGYDEEETHAQVVADIQAGKLKAEHWLDLQHPFALSDINKAFDALHERKMIKAVVRLSG
ncbi:MAG: zinc-binding dehydrogenase [Chloroflexi bacterium]|nr:zinc-binding dehydrogenase [Chloroflexota bacterium]